MRRTEVFPHPLGPTIARNSASRTAMSIESMTRNVFPVAARKASERDSTSTAEVGTASCSRSTDSTAILYFQTEDIPLQGQGVLYSYQVVTKPQSTSGLGRRKRELKVSGTFLTPLAPCLVQVAEGGFELVEGAIRHTAPSPLSRANATRLLAGIVIAAE